MGVLDYDGNQTNSSVTGIYGNQAAGTAPDTGEMRRKYNFSDKFTELAIDQTPFFRIVSKIGTKPTDDPQFKYTEKRQSWMKRYAYCVSVGTATDAQSIDGTESGAIGAETFLYFGTDYKQQGNIQNIIGQTGVTLGAFGTAPAYFLPNQMLKVPCKSATDDALATFDDYAIYRVVAATEGYVCNDAGGDASVALGKFKTKAEYAALSSPTESKWDNLTKVEVVIIKAAPDSSFLNTFDASNELMSKVTSVTSESDGTEGNSLSNHFQKMRTEVVGTAYKEGDTLMEKNWADQPYSTGFGYTQIFRNEFGMSNSARATVLKYEKNEWARLWRDKLIEHKWEIEQAALFGSQASTDDRQYTQGGVRYILDNGNLFNLNIAKKTQDAFLDDLSQLVDPRYNNSKKMLFFCNTETYNWLHKLSGYFSNNVGMVGSTTGQPIAGSLGRADFSSTGRKKLFGVDFTTISTIYGDINVARNIHLDGSGVKMMGINMDYVKWRPLVGNGVNRSTSVYVGVQTLENTGTDKRVDMILTEGGFEWTMPECHAIWK